MGLSEYMFNCKLGLKDFALSSANNELIFDTYDDQFGKVNLNTRRTLAGASFPTLYRLAWSESGVAGAVLASMPMHLYVKGELQPSESLTQYVVYQLDYGTAWFFKAKGKPTTSANDIVSELLSY